MDGNFMKQVRRVLLFETLFSGASSLSRVFSETESELDDMIRSIDTRVKSQQIFDGKLFNQNNNKK